MGVSTVFRSGPHSFGGRTWGSPVHRCDLSVFTAAGRAVLDGTDIYEAHNVRGWYYIAPPLLAIAMVPLAKLPMFWASLTWYLLSVAMIAAAVRMCVLTVGREETDEKNRFV